MALCINNQENEKETRYEVLQKYYGKEKYNWYSYSITVRLTMSSIKYTKPIIKILSIMMNRDNNGAKYFYEKVKEYTGFDDSIFEHVNDRIDVDSSFLGNLLVPFLLIDGINEEYDNLSNPSYKFICGFMYNFINGKDTITITYSGLDEGIKFWEYIKRNSKFKCIEKIELVEKWNVAMYNSWNSYVILPMDFNKCDKRRVNKIKRGMKELSWLSRPDTITNSLNVMMSEKYIGQLEEDCEVVSHDYSTICSLYYIFINKYRGEYDLSKYKYTVITGVVYKEPNLIVGYCGDVDNEFWNTLKEKSDVLSNVIVFNPKEI